MSNPMKPAESAETEEEKVIFENEDTAKLAAELVDKEELEIATLEGTGADGVITLDDIQTALDAKKAGTDPDADTDPADADTINYASDDAAEYAHEVKDKIDITKVVGTGKKDGGITKGDIKKAVEAVEKAEKAAQDAADAEAKKQAKANGGDQDEDEAVDETPTVEGLIEKLISFGIPVRGALNTKPKVQDEWNKLLKDAVYLQKNL